MPDPFTFNRSKSAGANPHSLVTASTWAANASLHSIRSMSASLRPARSSARAVAGTGPIPIVRGGTPATAHETIRPRGRNPNCSARAG